MKILVTPTSLTPEKRHPKLDQLRAFADELVFNPFGRPLKEDEMIQLLAGCDGCLAGLDFITEKVLASGKTLRAISRYGVGVDRVDIAAAHARGILVANTPGVNAEAVGELAFGMMLALARRLVYLDRKTRANEWVRSTGMELYGKRLGLIGLGAIGKVVARCAAGFGMAVLAYDPYLNVEYCNRQGIQPAELDELLRVCDVVSLHLPLTDETRHLIDAAALSGMKDGALLINASRGGIVDERAAYDALVSGKLGGLALDAFEQEPPTDSPLFALDNVLLTPHTGAHTREATENMLSLSVDNLIALLKGEPCPYVVNPAHP